MVGTVCCVAALWAPLAAQRPTSALDVSVGGTTQSQRVAGSLWRSVGHVARGLNMGLGVRISVYAGESTDYTNRGPVHGGLAPSLRIDPSVFALNGAVFGELSLGKRLGVGANLDLVGVATGPRRAAGSLVAKPQTLASFRYGPAERGALNSEFFVALRATDRMSLRVGASHYVTNYVVTDTMASGAPSSRYQKFETVPFVAVLLRL